MRDVYDTGEIGIHYKVKGPVSRITYVCVYVRILIGTIGTDLACVIHFHQDYSYSYSHSHKKTLLSFFLYKISFLFAEPGTYSRNIPEKNQIQL